MKTKFHDSYFCVILTCHNLSIDKFLFFIFRNFVCYYNFVHFTSRIKVTFSYLDLEDVFDYVEIYDGKKVGYTV